MSSDYLVTSRRSIFCPLLVRHKTTHSTLRVVPPILHSIASDSILTISSSTVLLHRMTSLKSAGAKSTLPAQVISHYFLKIFWHMGCSFKTEYNGFTKRKQQVNQGGFCFFVCFDLFCFVFIKNTLNHAVLTW